MLFLCRTLICIVPVFSIDIADRVGQPLASPFSNRGCDYRKSCGSGSSRTRGLYLSFLYSYCVGFPHSSGGNKLSRRSLIGRTEWHQNSTSIQGILAIGGSCGLHDPIYSPTPEALFLDITFFVGNTWSNKLLSKSQYQGNCGQSYGFDGFRFLTSDFTLDTCYSLIFFTSKTLFYYSHTQK